MNSIEINDVVRIRPETSVPTAWLIDIRNLLESRKVYRSLTNEATDSLFGTAEVALQKSVNEAVAQLQQEQETKDDAPAV